MAVAGRPVAVVERALLNGLCGCSCAAWCARTGNELVEVGENIVTVRRGQRPDLLAELAFRGSRLQRMDRDRLALQISLDSATPELHDQHRGNRSWERAVAGIRIAHAEGFRSERSISPAKTS
jgi:hypothetical protein